MSAGPVPPRLTAERWDALLAAARRADWVVNAGAAAIERPFASAKLGARNEVDRATLAKPPVPASPSVEGASDGER